MVCFLGKWDVSDNRRKRSADLFEWTRLPGLLTIEPAVPRNGLRLEDAHFLGYSNNIDVLRRKTRILHRLEDSLARHTTCHFHTAQALLRDCRKNLPVL